MSDAATLVESDPGWAVVLAGLMDANQAEIVIRHHDPQWPQLSPEASQKYATAIYEAAWAAWVRLGKPRPCGCGRCPAPKVIGFTPRAKVVHALDETRWFVCRSSAARPGAPVHLQPLSGMRICKACQRGLLRDSSRR